MYYFASNRVPRTEVRARRSQGGGVVHVEGGDDMSIHSVHGLIIRSSQRRASADERPDSGQAPVLTTGV